MNEIEKLNMIAEWQEQHKQLIEDLDNSKKRIAELEEAKANLEYLLEGRDNEIDELKAQIKVLEQNLEDTEICENGWKNRVEELKAQIEKIKVKWHNLEKDPNDLPKNCKTMCVCLGDFGSKYQPVPQVCVGYCDSLGWSDYMGSSLYSTVRYWCELPQF